MNQEPDTKILIRLPKELHRKIKVHSATLGISITKYLVFLLEQEEDRFFEEFLDAKKYEEPAD